MQVQRRQPIRQPLGLALLLIFCSGVIQAGDIYQEKSAFLQEVFEGDPPAPRLVWLNGDVREASRVILGHAYPGLRVRFWRRDDRTAWILEEIGKEKPITVGILLRGDKVALIRVLAYRESRGWEVRYPFFTDQFNGVSLDDNNALSRRIDGITGATLSVRALKKLARLALYLNTQSKPSNADI